MRRLLFLVLLIVPVIEIGLFILIGQTIGILPTLLGVLVTAVVGAALMRAQGLPLLGEIRTAFAAGRLPQRAIGEAMMVGVAGVLLMTPGYFTDTLGLLLLIPPVRAFAYRQVAARLAGIAVAGMPRQRPAPGPGTIDLDGESWRPR